MSGALLIASLNGIDGKSPSDRQRTLQMYPATNHLIIPLLVAEDHLRHETDRAPRDLQLARREAWAARAWRLLFGRESVATSR